MGKTELLITVILFNLFFVFFLVAIMIYIKKYKLRKMEYVNEIEIKNEIHQKELLETQLEIQKSTMRQIGQDIHDNIGQKLTLVSLYTQQVLYENTAPEAKEKLEQISQIINQSLQDLRSLSKTLTDNNINQKQIINLIQEEVDKTNTLKKCNVTFEYNSKHLDLEFSHKNVLLRITQEFLQNSIKHSNCNNIFIVLNSSEESIWELNIQDDGDGFDISKTTSQGIGLTNMKNRAEIIGANFNLESILNKGTTVSIILKRQS